MGSTGERLGVRVGARQGLGGLGRGECRPVGGPHSKAHGGLQGRAGPGLAADVVEGEEQVVVLGHTGRKTQLELFIELRGPGRAGLEFCWGLRPPLLPHLLGHVSPVLLAPLSLLSASGSPTSVPRTYPSLPSSCPSPQRCQSPYSTYLLW